MSTVNGCSDGVLLLTIVQLSSHTSSEQRGKTFSFPLSFFQDESGSRFIAFSGEGQSLRKKGRKP